MDVPVPGRNDARRPAISVALRQVIRQPHTTSRTRARTTGTPVLEAPTLKPTTRCAYGTVSGGAWCG
jgi:hypothetical protein